jgi:uncharacterized protein with HEPN domain
VNPRGAHARLDDIIEAIDVIRSHEERLEAAGFGRDDRARLDAVVRQVAVIGEAVARLDDDIKEDEPDIPWKDIAGMQLVLDHDYFQVEPGVVWRVVDEDLQELREAVERILRRRFGEDLGDVEHDHTLVVDDAARRQATNAGAATALCGRTVRSTGLPCRLASGHRGRCRSR